MIVYILRRLAAVVLILLGVSVITYVLLFLIPATRRNLVTLNLGCVLIFVGVYIEKSIGLVVPGFTPSVLGEIYEYDPTMNEFLVGLGILGVGALLFTLMSRVAIHVANGTFRLGEPRADADSPA